MYTGTNKTALNSQQQIADAFVSLLRQTGYSSISISAVCKAADVSRQTFYSLFESKENLILYLLDKKHSFLPGQTCCRQEMSFAELSREYSTYMSERREFLKLLVKNDLIYLMHEYLYRSFMDCPLFLPEMKQERRNFAAEFVSGGLAGIARIYAETRNMGQEELADVIEGLFTGSFFQ